MIRAYILLDKMKDNPNDDNTALRDPECKVNSIRRIGISTCVHNCKHFNKLTHRCKRGYKWG